MLILYISWWNSCNIMNLLLRKWITMWNHNWPQQPQVSFKTCALRIFGISKWWMNLADNMINKFKFLRARFWTSNLLFLVPQILVGHGCLKAYKQKSSKTVGICTVSKVFQVFSLIYSYKLFQQVPLVLIIRCIIVSLTKTSCCGFTN